MATAVTGGVYRVRLGLDAPAAMHPAWLVGAAGARYPGAEVVSIEPRGKDRADVTLRWRSSRPGELSEGDQLVPVTEGMQLIPGADMPSATVKDVEVVRAPMAARSLELGRVDATDILKLLGAAALIGYVAWASYRIEGEAHG